MDDAPDMDDLSRIGWLLSQYDIPADVVTAVVRIARVDRERERERVRDEMKTYADSLTAGGAQSKGRALYLAAGTIRINPCHERAQAGK